MRNLITQFGWRHRFWLLLLGFALSLVLLLRFNPPLSAGSPGVNVAVSSQEPELPPLQLIDYIDPAAGFSARVPQSWHRIVQNQPGDVGVTVSFESPATSDRDEFADYLMVEIQPGDRVVVLDETPSETVPIVAAGRELERERIVLPGHPVADTALDLVVWQLTWRQQHFSIGIYAVGEQREEARLERLLIEFAQSFDLPTAPFMLIRYSTPNASGFQRSG